MSHVKVKMSAYEQCLNMLNELTLRQDKIVMAALEELEQQRDDALDEVEVLKETESRAIQMARASSDYWAGVAKDSAAAALKDAETIRDLRAEVERLNTLLDGSIESLREHMALARTAAERQREACAEYLKHWTYDEHDLARVRSTPLVTEEK